MLDARAALLASGVYAPIAHAVAVAVADAVQRTIDESTDGVAGADTPAPDDRSPADRLAPGLSVADLGCGTGYYAASVLDRVLVARLLAADRSPDAVRATLRALSDRVPTTGVVLDLWRPLPLRDASADVVLDVFAPRNPPEYARVLAPGGTLIVVVPTAAHLSGLRETAGMLDIPGGKATLVADQFAAAGLRRATSTRIEYVIEADASARALIVGMGPSAHHRDAHAPAARAGKLTPDAESRPDEPPASIEASNRGEASDHDESSASAEADPREVTVSVDVLTLRAN